jgi:hypothetical protein
MAINNKRQATYHWVIKKKKKQHYMHFHCCLQHRGTDPHMNYEYWFSQFHAANIPATLLE